MQPNRQYIFLKGCWLLVYLVCTASLFSQQSKPFNLKIGAYRGTIQWEQSTDRHNWANVANGNKDELTVTPGTTTFYRAKITEPGCAPVYSDLKAVYADTAVQSAAKNKAGKIILPAGSGINFSDLTILSLFEEVKPANDGSFEILISDSTKEHMLMVLDKQDNPILLSYHTEPAADVNINSESTAMALLMMYPFLKPVKDEDKGKFVEFYRGQTEYAALISAIEKIVKDKKPLFSANNTQVISLASTLVQKDINKDRWKSAQGNRTNADPFNIFSSGESAVTLSNLSAFNYTARIYNMRSEPVTPPITVEGTEIAEFSFVKYLYMFYQWAGDESTDINGESKIDLKKTYNLPPGNYTVKVTNGFFNDGSAEDKEAFRKNLWGIFSVSLYSLIDLTDLMEAVGRFKFESCLKSFLDTEIASLNPFNVKNSIENNTFLREYLIPILVKLSPYLAACYPLSATHPDYPRYMRMVSKLSLVYALVDKGLPIAYYLADWRLSQPSFTGCQFLNENFRTSNCFKIEKTSNIKPSTYTCDSAELKIRIVEDNVYYQHTGNPMPFTDFKWTSTGEGVFLPSQTGSVNAKTNQKGEASIKWKMPPAGATGEQTARAIVQVNGSQLIGLAEFKTNTVDAKPEARVTAEGLNQVGKVGSILTNPVILQVFDKADNLQMKLDRFTITTQITGGGSIEPDGELPLIKTWKWKLGAAKGEQRITITVTSKDCGWPVMGSPFIIKATAIDKPVLTTTALSSIGIKTATGGGNITDDGGSPVTAKGICWSTASNPTARLSTKTNDGAGKGIFTSNITGLEPGKKYFVRAYAINGADTAYGNELSFTTESIKLPTLSTSAVSAITQTTATSGGNIADDGGSPVTSRGVVWSELPNPTIDLSTKTTNGTGKGTYSSNMNFGLEAGKEYFVRSYASNELGTAYGNEVSFMTKDPDTFTYVCTYWIPGTIVNWTFTLKLHFEGGSVTGRGLITNHAYWGPVKGTISGTTMTLNYSYDNLVTPQCETIVPNEPPACPTCYLKMFPGGNIGVKEAWVITGTVNNKHSSYNATYTRKITYTQLVGGEDCGFGLIKSEGNESGLLTY